MFVSVSSPAILDNLLPDECPGLFFERLISLMYSSYVKAMGCLGELSGIGDMGKRPRRWGSLEPSRKLMRWRLERSQRRIGGRRQGELREGGKAHEFSS